MNLSDKILFGSLENKAKANLQSAKTVYEQHFFLQDIKLCNNCCLIPSRSIF